MSELWTETPIHVLDFEGSRATGVVEYGIATLLGGKVTQTHTRICAPRSGFIPQTETQVHGIGRAETAGAPPFATERSLFVDLRNCGPLCAHNAAFEKHLLKSIWPYPRSSPDFLRPGREIADWGPWADTLRLYERVYPDLPEYGLGALLDTFALTEELNALAAEHCPPSRSHYHCALYDALGSALLLLHMGREKGFEDMSLPWLLAHSGDQNNAAQTELF